jgi:hypothetical protein
MWQVVGFVNGCRKVKMAVERVKIVEIGYMGPKGV